MCGRFAFYTPKEAVANLFEVDCDVELEPRYNIAPTQYSPVVRLDNDAQRELVMMRWGLVPFWAKDKTIGNRMINARAETVSEKPAFRSAYKRRRCLVMANGFYEWKRFDDQKIPYFIGMKDEQSFAMAGLWEQWTKGDDGILHTFTILTTSANEFMTGLHHRMPVILAPQNYAAWLGSEEQQAIEPDTLLRPYENEVMRAYAVGKMVNNARNEGPQLIEPAQT